MSKRSTDHVVLGGTKDEVAHCTHCGRGLSLKMPVETAVFVAATKAFAKAHRTCRPTWQEPPVTRQNWPDSRDTGISSRAIWSFFTAGAVNGQWKTSNPSDPSDFGRCHRLLVLFPEWRPRLPELAAARPEWAGLVAHWDELTALYLEELPAGRCPRLYARMQELTR